MKRTLFLLTASALLLSTGCRASDHGFDAVAQGVEHRYSVHPRHVPLMGFASLCARLTTHGGVKEMRIAQFNHIERVDAAELGALLQARLGSEWRPFVSSRQANNEEDSLMFVRPDGQAMRMLIADYDHGELNLVRMDLSGAALSKWMKRRGYGGHTATE